MYRWTIYLSVGTHNWSDQFDCIGYNEIYCFFFQFAQRDKVLTMKVYVHHVKEIPIIQGPRALAPIAKELHLLTMKRPPAVSVYLLQNMNFDIE